MFSWLFGKKKQKQKKRAQPAKMVKARATYGDVKSVPVVDEPAPAWEPKGKESEEMMAKMGGAEILAAVIKDMLAEDKRNKRRRSS